MESEAEDALRQYIVECSSDGRCVLCRSVNTRTLISRCLHSLIHKELYGEKILFPLSTPH